MRLIKVLLIVFIFINFFNYAKSEVISIYDKPNEGDIFIGESDNNRAPNGLGVFSGANGYNYMGEFLKGEFSGLTKVFFKNINYSGRFLKGKRSGYGVEETSKDLTYGFFSNDKLEHNTRCIKVENKSDKKLKSFCFKDGEWIIVKAWNFDKKKQADTVYQNAKKIKKSVNLKYFKALEIEKKYLKKYPHTMLDATTICSRATTLNGSWESYDSKFNSYRYEADKRLLNINKCNSLTGRIPKSAASETLEQITKTANQSTLALISFAVILIFFLIIFIRSRSITASASGMGETLDTDEIKSVYKVNDLIIKTKGDLSKGTKTRDELSHEWREATKIKKMKLENKIAKAKKIIVEDKTKIKDTLIESKSKDMPIESKKISETKLNDKKIDNVETENKKKSNKSKILVVSDASMVKTKVCSFCETENTGDKLNCIICLKPLA